MAEAAEHDPADDVSESGPHPAGMIDLTRIPLWQLTELDNPVLAACVRRLHDDVGNSAGAAAGFNSSV